MSDDCGICAGDVPPLIGQVLTGTGLTLDQAARRLANGEDLPALTPICRSGWSRTTPSAPLGARRLGFHQRGQRLQ